MGLRIRNLNQKIREQYAKLNERRYFDAREVMNASQNSQLEHKHLIRNSDGRIGILVEHGGQNIAVWTHKKVIGEKIGERKESFFYKPLEGKNITHNVFNKSEHTPIIVLTNAERIAHAEKGRLGTGFRLKSFEKQNIKPEKIKEGQIVRWTQETGGGTVKKYHLRRVIELHGVKYVINTHSTLSSPGTPHAKMRYEQYNRTINGPLLKMEVFNPQKHEPVVKID